MLDNQLYTLIESLLTTGLAAIGQSAILTQQAYQPTQQGANSPPTIYFYKIGPDRNIGTPNRNGVQGQGACSFTGSIAGTVLTVTGIVSGTLNVNQGLVGAGISTNIIITSFGTGSGGEGTYNLNQSPGTIPSEAMLSAGTWVYTETQQKASLFQCVALATQDPANTNQLTASDIANLGCYVMQSAQTISALEAQGCGVLRIPEVRNPYFTDDRERYEASPSFDFTLTHNQQIITSIPVVTETVFQVLDV